MNLKYQETERKIICDLVITRNKNQGKLCSAYYHSILFKYDSQREGLMIHDSKLV